MNMGSHKKKPPLHHKLILLVQEAQRLQPKEEIAKP